MIRQAATAALLTLGVFALAGCPDRGQPPQYGNQYPQGQYPQGQYPQGQYPQGQYPQTRPQPAPYPGYPQQRPPAQPAPQQPQPGYPPAAPQAPPPAAPPPVAPPPAAPAPAPTSPFPFPPPAGPAPQPPAGGSGGATLLNPAAATVATIPLNAYANQQARGMSPATDVIAGQFKQGQVMEQTFQMQPGKCYSALAVGAGIQNMHIRIVAVTPLPNVPGLSSVLAESKTKGANAAISPCYKWGSALLPVAINAKAIFTATAGQGIAAGRVYVK